MKILEVQFAQNKELVKYFKIKILREIWLLNLQVPIISHS
jgi:hypothetical protein